jgi:alpha-glucosidase
MKAWWQDGPIYQLLVPSFQDSNGDGTGDIGGILQHIDYFPWLGVRALWLSPIFPSPMKEFGYDVSDYTNVNPLFGTLEEFDALLAAAHQRDLKVVLDWVPNHTSNEHPWFAASRSSQTDPKRHWYLWRDRRDDGQPPNNWVSVFGGSVWEWDERTRQYYLHSFLPEQPDLNWREPAVRHAVYDAMRFWLDRGVDGFRIDAASWIVKDDQFRDNPPNPDYDASRHAPDEAVLPTYTRDQPFGHQVMREMRRLTDGYPERALLGELYGRIEQVAAYFGEERCPELHLPLHMGFAWLPWSATEIGGAVEDVYTHLPPHGWPAWVLSGHDTSRLASRTEGEQTRNAVMLLCTLRGTPIFYYGEEVGMRGVPIPPEHARDPQGKRIGRNRDPERTPMQWNHGTHSGFSTAVPWLPIGDDAAAANVAAQSDDPHSLLSLYRRLVALRRAHPVLADGGFELASKVDPLLGFWRALNDRRVLVVLNFSGDNVHYDIPGDARHGRVLLSTFLDRQEEVITEGFDLRGQEGVIVEIG